MKRGDVTTAYKRFTYLAHIRIQYKNINVHMKPAENDEPVEVFAGTAWQAEMVKSLLADIQIEAFIVDGIVGTLTPWYTSPGGAGAVKVIVSRSNFERAKAAVDEYQENINKA